MTDYEQTQVGVTLKPELKEELRTVCKQHHVSMSEVVRRGIIEQIRELREVDE